MFSLKKLFRTETEGLPDLLQWANLIDEGIILQKDGSLLAGYYYRGSDLASSTDDEKNYISARINDALKQLGNGWAVWFEAIRMPADGYPERYNMYFPDKISSGIDEERRQSFNAEGHHYESEYVLLIQFTPPLLQDKKIEKYIYDHDPEANISIATKTLNLYKKALEELQDRLGSYLKMRRMTAYYHEDSYGKKHLRDELINYLQYSLTGEFQPINIPQGVGVYLDCILGALPFYTGETPKLGDKYISCVTIDGFAPESYMGVLDILDHLPMSYRWSTRYIPMDGFDAEKELEKHRRQWKQKERGFIAQTFNITTSTVNEDAVRMRQEAEGAIADATSQAVSFGFYSTNIVIYGKNLEEARENARFVAKEIRREGFSARIETVGAVEAILGTLGGHAKFNVRKSLIHSLNLTDMLPLSAVWSGRQTNPCPFYPSNSPPLMMAATSGTTPFRLNLHVGDVGHTLIFGPTGAGKSTLLALIAAQHRRYAKAKITAFDKGNSLFPLTMAVGGKHYDIGSDYKPIGLCPLYHLESSSDMAFANEWLATMFELQAQQQPTPAQRNAINKSLELARENGNKENGYAGRTLTEVVASIQDEEIRSALNYYTLGGSAGLLLDAQQDGISESDFTTFEIEELMNMGEALAIPVLLYLFRRFEKSLDGSPAMLILDEAWIMLGHPVFREKIREWLKVLRKANCAVVLATQSISDAAKSNILDVLLESCPTKILLPNEEADKAGTDNIIAPKDLYVAVGLNETQIDIIKNATKKRHYYYISPEGRRLFDLNIGKFALAFVGVSDKEQLNRIRSLIDIYGDRWAFEWLKERNVDYENYIQN